MYPAMSVDRIGAGTLVDRIEARTRHAPVRPEKEAAGQRVQPCQYIG